MIRVSVVYSPGPRQVTDTVLTLQEGSTVAQALDLAGPSAWQDSCRSQDESAQWTIGLWGRKTAVETVLREGDRIELCRPLRVDPKVARRERFVGQGARNAGLFARRRPHSKAGY